MKRRIGTILALSALALLSLGIAACGSTAQHKHTYTEMKAVAATCSETGVKAHKKCLYCGAFFLNGKEVEEEELATPVDPKNHTLEDVAEVKASCLRSGMRAHQVCVGCDKLFLNGDEVTAESLTLASSGEHVFEGNYCIGCNAFKLSYEGKVYTLDDTNYMPFTASEGGTDYVAGSKDPFLKDYFVHRNTFSTQRNKNGAVEGSADSWKIIHDRNLGSFTRFAYGVNGEAYIGRFLLTIDVEFSAQIGVDRLGIRLVNSGATDTWKAQQSLLLGTDAGEENNPNRVFEGKVVYRLAYCIEVTAEDQLIQLFLQMNAGTATFSNLHIIPIEGSTGGLSCILLSVGTPQD